MSFINPDLSHADMSAAVKNGTALFMGLGPAGCRFSTRRHPDFRRLRPPRIGIYAGKGASHSWLWFVDLFEKAGFWDLVFLDEQIIRKSDLSGLDVLVVSGGDTFAVAEALGAEGSARLLSFVRGGGTYMGSCAGAYLPMNSSKKPLDLFNFVDVKITNLTKILPEVPGDDFKYRTAYGCDYVFHPVREAVKLEAKSGPPFAGVPAFAAPLFGGPGMTHDNPENILAVYSAFTDKTAFFVPRETAENTLIGKAAVIRVPKDDGCFYLFGPHLEHPHYLEANAFVANAVLWETAGSENGHHNSFRSDMAHLTGKPAKELIRDLKRELSNARIAASGLEFVPVRWMIGKKAYDPVKIRVFLEAMWKRIAALEKSGCLLIAPDARGRLVDEARQAARLLRGMKNDIDDGMDTLEQATLLFQSLQKLSVFFFELYFASKDRDVFARSTKRTKPTASSAIRIVTGKTTMETGEEIGNLAN